MNNRNTRLTESAIKQLIHQHYSSWKSVDPSQITISRLSGLTNITYRAQAQIDITPNNIVFREFGNTEGFVDSHQERIIFSTISELNLGPKQLKVGECWRMEEFVTGGIHPTNRKMADAEFQFKCMGVLQKFHQVDVPIKNTGTSVIIQKTLSNNMKESILHKIEKRDLYTEIELKELEKIECFLNDQDEYDYLDSMVRKENHEEIKFCHNDLNQLNIFNTNKPNREIVFIDYEYCSYNYPSYDIANFLNESTINYQYEEAPYYELVEDNFQTGISQSQFLSLSYIIHQECTEEEIQSIQNIVNENTNKSQNELKKFIIKIKEILKKRLSALQIQELFDQVDYLKRRIRRHQIISNLNWVWWSILLAHEKNSLEFEYIDYGMLRFKMFDRLLKLEKERDQ